MSEETQRQELWKKMVVYQLPGADAVTVRRDVKYADALTMDLYYPPDAKSGARMPAVVIVAGYPDPGGKLKEMGWFISWARLAAASGLVAITYANAEPGADIHTVLQYVRQNAAELGIDENRIGLAASSGNVPVALSVLMQEPRDYLKCAVLFCGFMLDFDGSSGVAEAAKQFGFAAPGEGKSVDDVPKDVPLFIARAGQEQFPHLNESIDRFVAKALHLNLPITLVNYPAGPHAFDLMVDSETSRAIIRQILAFMQFHLLG